MSVTLSKSCDSISPSYYRPSSPLFSSKPVSFHDLVENTQEKGFFIAHSTASTQYASLPTPQASYDAIYTLDDTETRNRLWQFFFPSQPLPNVKEGAVEENYGLFDKHFKGASQEQLRKLLEEALNE